MKILYVLPVLAVVVSGCTTPKTMLKNPESGQIVSCGGSATGSLVGGVVGYNIQKSNDSKCVEDYKKQGFELIRVKSDDDEGKEY